MKRLGRHLDRLRACFARMPDPRRGDNRRYAMADIGMAALSGFLMQSPSFLAHQRALAEGRVRSNAHTLFGLDRIPCDNHVRQLLDGVLAEHFDAQFHAIVGDLDAHGGLAAMRCLDDCLLVALDGTECPLPPVRAPAHRHRLPSVPLLDRAHDPARHRRTCGTPSLTSSARLRNPINPTAKSQ